jgi:hypothetical protein
MQLHDKSLSIQIQLLRSSIALSSVRQDSSTSPPSSISLCPNFTMHVGFLWVVTHVAARPGRSHANPLGGRLLSQSKIAISDAKHHHLAA